MSEIPYIKPHNPYEDVARWKAYAMHLEQLLRALKTGDCWCGVGVGVPYMPGHSAVCQEVKGILK